MTTGQSVKDHGIAARHEGPLPVNVNQVERILSGALGGGMLLAALGRRPWTALLMGSAAASLLYRSFTGHCHVYGALGIDTTRRRPATAVPAQQGYRVEKSIVIDRPADELYQAWEDIEELPSLVDHLVSVQDRGNNRSHWIAKGPLGTTIEWDAEVICQRENRMISWRSLPGSQVDTAGSVHFEPSRTWRGSVVRVNLKYNPPAGKAGAILAAFLGQGLDERIEEDLARFKRNMESGAPVVPPDHLEP